MPTMTSRERGIGLPPFTASIDHKHIVDHRERAPGEREHPAGVIPRQADARRAEVVAPTPRRTWRAPLPGRVAWTSERARRQRAEAYLARAVDMGGQLMGFRIGVVSVGGRPSPPAPDRGASRPAQHGRPSLRPGGAPLPPTWLSDWKSAQKIKRVRQTVGRQSLAV